MFNHKVYVHAVLTSTFLFASLHSQSNIKNSVDATATLIEQCQYLLDHNVLDIKGLTTLAKANEPSNTASGSKAYDEEETYKTYKKLNKLINQHHDDIDMAKVRAWAQHQVSIYNQTIKQEINKSAQPMTFVSIPAGSYKNHIDGSTFTIPAGLELQTTPVTQSQWLSIMDSNPSSYALNEGETDAKQIGSHTLLTDHPVENVSYTDIQRFIGTLNKEGDHQYFLPSINEYQAILEQGLENTWIEKLHTLPVCTNSHPCIVNTWREHLNTPPECTSNDTCKVTDGFSISISTKKIWNIIGNTWEYTRDHVTLDSDFTGHLVFGSSYKTTSPINDINQLVKPIVYDQTKDGSIGFRLLRTPKNILPTNNDYYVETTYVANTFQWSKETHNQELDQQNKDWRMEKGVYHHDDDALTLMLERKEQYSIEVQHTIEALLTIALDQQDPVRYLKDLTSLDLSNRKLTDISPLAYLSNLEVLNLEDNLIEDPTSLAALPHLINLNLNNNRISDAQGLSELSSIEQLHIANNQISSIEPLVTLKNLKGLSLGGNTIENVHQLEQLKNLEHLDLSNNKLLNINSLMSLTQLASLELAHNEIIDIAPLSGLTGIEHLSLENNKIKNIDALAEMKHLWTLNLSNNQISSVEALSELSYLTHLFLAKNQITDIRPLYALENLHEVDLHSNKPLITDREIEPMLECSLIKSVSYSTDKEASGKGRSGCINFDLLYDD